MKRRSAIIGAAILAAVVGFARWWGPLDSGVPPFEKATVAIHGNEEGKLMELSFAQREWLHTLLSDVPRDRSAKKWQIFATARLYDSAGSQVSQIEVYSNPNGSGPFRIGEHYFIGYDQKEFREMLELPETPESGR